MLCSVESCLELHDNYKTNKLFIQTDALTQVLTIKFLEVSKNDFNLNFFIKMAGLNCNCMQACIFKILGR